jgi:hypothetical protein
MLQAARLWVGVQMRLLRFFNLPNHSSCTRALVFTQSLTDKSTRSGIWGKVLPVHKADDLTTIYDTID